MRRRSLALVAAGLTTAALIGPSGAAAAVEVGNSCGGVMQTYAPGYTMLQTAKGAGAVTAPSAGIVTKWRVVSAAPTPSPNLIQLRVFRPTGNANEFKAVAESALATVVTGENVFETRIPVQAGDYFGTYGTAPSGPIYCAGVTGDQLGYVTKNVPVGATETFIPAANLHVGALVTIEADADGDGFGDESQDQCPRSAATQTACPLIVLDAVPVAKKGSVILFVSTTTTTPVTVSGTVKVAGKRKKGAQSSAQLTLPSVTRTITAGTVGRIPLKFPAKLKAALSSLPPKRTLKLKLSATATDVAGVVTTDPSTVKVKGQAKP